MKRLLWTNFFVIILLIFIGLASCIHTGDEERPGMYVSTELFLNKVWQVSLFSDDRQNKTILFGDVYLEFRPNFIFRITKGCEVIEGEWILSSDSTLLVIRIPDHSPEPLDQLEDEWVVTWLTESEMRFIEQDNKGDEEFHLSKAALPALNCKSCDNLSQALTDSVWSISSLVSGSNDHTEETRGTYLDFHSNGEVVLHTNYSEAHGLWAITDNCQMLEVQWLDGQSVDDLYLDLGDSWIVHEFDNQYISLETEDNTSLHMTKGLQPDCESLRNDLLQTSWSIDQVTINGDNVSKNFAGTGFTFLEGNQLATEVIVGPAVLGQWMLSGNCDIMVLDIQAGHLKELSRDWTIQRIQEDQVTLVFEEGTLHMEMRLVKGKPTISDNCNKLINFLTDGKWSVSGFTSTEQEVNDNFDGYSFNFGTDGSVSAYSDDMEFTGRWHPSGDCEYLVIEVDQNTTIKPLTGVWKIIETQDNMIKLVYEKMSKRKTVEFVRI